MHKQQQQQMRLHKLQQRVMYSQQLQQVTRSFPASLFCMLAMICSALLLHAAVHLAAFACSAFFLRLTRLRHAGALERTRWRIVDARARVIIRRHSTAESNAKLSFILKEVEW